MNEELFELPVGWAWVKLGEVGTIIGGGTPRRNSPEYFENGTIPWATPTDIDQKEILTIFSTAEKITEKAVRESSAKVLPAGAVLFSSRASIGKIAIAGTQLATNQGFANIIPSSVLDSKYLAYGLRRFTKDIERLGSGTTYVEVAKSSLKEFHFPLAPLSEQRRIVAKVEALFAENKTALEALDKEPVLLRRFRRSVLAKAFRGELTQFDPKDEPAQKLLERMGINEEKSKNRHQMGNERLPSGWALIKLSDICSTSSGGTPLRSKVEYYGGDTPWIKSGELEDDVILSSEEKISKEGLENSSAKIYPKGTVVVALYGATVGKTGILGIDAATNQAVCAIFNDEHTLEKKYLFYFLRSKREDFLKISFGGAQPNISQGVIRDTAIPLAPLSEQRRIVTRIEELFGLANSIENATNKAKERVERINQAILAKAFRGELVPQDPDDESASILLQRIKRAQDVA